MEQLGSKNYHNTFLGTLFFFLLISAPSIVIYVIPGIGSMNFFRISSVVLTLYALTIFKNKANNIFDVTLLLLGSHIIFCFISILWAENKNYGIANSINYLFCIAFTLSFSYIFSNRKDLEKYFLYCGYLMIILSFLGVFETFTGYYIFPINEIFLNIKGPYGLNTPITVFGNPNDFVFSQLSVLPFFFYAINKRIKKRNRIVFIKLIYIVMILYIAFVGQTRIAILILIFMGLVTLLCSKKYGPLVFIALIFAGVILVFSELLGLTNIIKRVFEEKRIQIWLDIIRNLKGHFLFGKGIGNGQLIGGSILNPHFWFLEIIADLGIVLGSNICFWFVYLFIKNIKFNAHIAAHHEAHTCIIFLLSLLPMSIMSSSIAFSPILWLCISFTILLTMQAKKNIKDANCLTSINVNKPKGVTL